MIYQTLFEFATHLKDYTRLLGLDMGNKRIGFALSDTMRMVATADHTYERKALDKDIEYLLNYVQEHEVGGIVIGLPLQMDGTEGESCKMVRTFADAILKAKDIPIFLQDERLSTTAVTRVLKDANLSRKKREQHDDKLAASFILQGTLNGLGNA